MKALEVILNGKRLCLAGSGPNERTCLAIDMVDREECENQPLGAISVFGQRGKVVIHWNEDFIPFQSGDELIVRIVDVDSVDPHGVETPAWTECPSVDAKG